MARRGLFGNDYAVWIGPATTVGRGKNKREDVDASVGKVLYIGPNRTEADTVFARAAVEHRKYGGPEAWFRIGNDTTARSSEVGESFLRDAQYRLPLTQRK